MSKTTPKKFTSRGRKASISIINVCRICKICFKIENGSVTCYNGYENLFLPSRQVSFQGLILSDLLRTVGLKIDKTNNLSDRVCAPCARRIRSLHKEYNFISSYLSRNQEENKADKESKNDGEDLEKVRFKRCLPTSVTPERSSAHKKNLKTQEKRNQDATSKKSLFSENISLASKANAKSAANENWELGHLNADDLLMVQDGSKSSKVKVLIVYPSGNVVVRIPQNQQTASLLH